MTKQEFENTSFKKGMKIKINRKIFEIMAIDFELGLIGTFFCEKDYWHHRSECKLINKKNE